MSQSLSIFFFCLSVCLSLNNITEKMVERVFVKFSGYMALSTRTILQHFGNVPFNPLHWRIVFLIFSREPVFVSNIMKKCVKGFTWKFHGLLLYYWIEHVTPNCQICILNYDNIHGSFMLCNWFFLWCLVPWIKHLPPVCYSTFWKSRFNDN